MQTRNATRPAAWLICGLATLIVGPSVAIAATIKFEFAGTITGSSTPMTGIAAGTPWQVTATFSGDVQDPGENRGAYSRYQLRDYTLSIGSGISVTIVPSSAGFQSQTVRLDVSRSASFNGNQLVFSNSLSFVASNYSSGGGGASLPITPIYMLDGRKLLNSFVELYGAPGTLWGRGDNLFTRALDYGLEDYETARFAINFVDDRTLSTKYEGAAGTVEQYRVTVIPLPSAGIAFLSALIVMGVRRARSADASVQQA